jgi:hypothetical protein
VSVLFCSRLNFLPGDGIDRSVFGPPPRRVTPPPGHAGRVRARIRHRQELATLRNEITTLQGAQ